MPAQYSIEGLPQTTYIITDKTYHQTDMSLVEEKARRIAFEEGISEEKLFNLIESESKWDIHAVGKDGEIGLCQIIPSVHSITEEEARDPETCLRYTAQKIKEGKEFLWSPCSCVKGVRIKMLQKGIDFPRINARDLKPNSPPATGGVVIFNYDGVWHLAYIMSLHEEYLLVYEHNFEPCKVGTRRVSYDDPRIEGFWFWSQ